MLNAWIIAWVLAKVNLRRSQLRAYGIWIIRESIAGTSGVTTGVDVYVELVEPEEPVDFCLP